MLQMLIIGGGMVFKEFRIKPVSLKYTVSKGKQTTGRELLITNY